MRFARVIFLILFCVALPVRADSAQLYTGEVVVSDQGSAAREAAFPAALRQVLGKLSGLGHFDDHPMVEPAISDARSLVLAFHYRETDILESEDEAERETHLVVQFAQPGVERLMHQLALPRWPPDREALTVWLVIDDGQARRIMPLEYSFLKAPLTLSAKQRGLPLSWPEPGEEDDYGVDIQLLWGGYTDSVGEDHVLLIAARREGPEWNVRMTLEYASDYSSWRNRHVDLETALLEGLEHAIDLIAQAHSIDVSDQGNYSHEIVVAGLNSAQDYSRSMSYLQSLSVVDNVEIESAEPGRVRMVLELNASPRYLQEAISASAVLEYDEAADQYVLKR